MASNYMKPAVPTDCAACSEPLKDYIILPCTHRVCKRCMRKEEQRSKVSLASDMSAIILPQINSLMITCPVCEVKQSDEDQGFQIFMKKPSSEGGKKQNVDKDRSEEDEMRAEIRRLKVENEQLMDKLTTLTREQQMQQREKQQLDKQKQQQLEKQQQHEKDD